MRPEPPAPCGCALRLVRPNPAARSTCCDVETSHGPATAATAVGTPISVPARLFATDLVLDAIPALGGLALWAGLQQSGLGSVVGKASRSLRTAGNGVPPPMLPCCPTAALLMLRRVVAQAWDWQTWWEPRGARTRPPAASRGRRSTPRRAPCQVSARGVLVCRVSTAIRQLTTALPWLWVHTTADMVAYVTAKILLTTSRHHCMRSSISDLSQPQHQLQQTVHDLSDVPAA